MSSRGEHLSRIVPSELALNPPADVEAAGERVGAHRQDQLGIKTYMLTPEQRAAALERGMAPSRVVAYAPVPPPRQRENVLRRMRANIGGWFR